MSIEQKAGSRLLGVAIVIVAALLIVGAIMFFVKPYLARKKIQSTSSSSQYKYSLTEQLDGFTGYCFNRSSALNELEKMDSVRVIIKDDAADYPARMKALQEGKADIAVFTIDSFVKAGLDLGEFPATIIAVIDESRGADAVVAYKTAVKSAQDITGFVGVGDSPSEYFARIFKSDLFMPHLGEKWFESIDKPEKVLSRFKGASKTDPKAYVLWEPFLSMALEDPDAYVVMGSEKLKGQIVDVIVVNRDFLKDHYDLVKGFVKNYLTTVYNYSQAGMIDLVISDSKITGDTLSKERAEKIVKGIQWKNTLENYAHFGLLKREESRGLDNMEDMITRIHRVLVKTGAVGSDKQIQPNTLFFDKILADLQASGFHPGKGVGVLEGDSGRPAESVRGNVQLKELSEQEWASLIPIGNLLIEPLEFLRGTSDLTIQSRRDLEDLASKLKSMPGYYLTVIGHARAEGDPEANKQLALERATMASEYLVLRLGVSRSRVKAISTDPSRSDGSAQSVTFQLGQLPY
jgi:hypothetical protein